MCINPILFSTEMVQAILTGRKTQTRRLMKPQPYPVTRFGAEKQLSWEWDQSKKITDLPDFEWVANAPIKIGDILWVRETFGTVNKKIIYKSDICSPQFDKPKTGWKPSLFMPKTACRLFLKVVNVRVERLNEISRGDSMSEGCHFANMSVGPNPKDWFINIWLKINGKDSWNENPFVWVYEFEITDKPENFGV